MKLGELLIKAGKITPAQLEEVLKGQAIFGGRFGTNLVEMGYIDEHDLAHFLSKKLGVPHAAPEQLMDIPPQILRLVPEEIVKKYQVVPIALNNRKLTLAMIDPSDLGTIDEISFMTGYIVIPVITPELRLVTALEKHYQIKRQMRYISVEGGGRNRARMLQNAAVQETLKQPPPSRPAPSRPSPVETFDLDILELPMLEEFECFGDMEQKEPQPPIRFAASAPTLAAGAPKRETENDFSLEAVLRGLAQASDRHGIAELIVNYAAQKFNRAALFLLKGGKATGWVAQHGKKPVPNFETWETPLSEPSILRVVNESKNFYLGPMPITPGNSRLIAALGGGTPMNNLLVPLMMMGRVVAILYVEGGPLSLDEQLPELQKLLGKGSMAFEILILKSKILLT
jgi:hypothetical protein